MSRSIDRTCERANRRRKVENILIYSKCEYEVTNENNKFERICKQKKVRGIVIF